MERSGVAYSCSYALLVLPTARGVPGWSLIQVLPRWTVPFDFGDLTGTGMSPPLGRRVLGDGRRLQHAKHKAICGVPWCSG